MYCFVYLCLDRVLKVYSNHWDKSHTSNTKMKEGNRAGRMKDRVVSKRREIGSDLKKPVKTKGSWEDEKEGWAMGDE